MRRAAVNDKICAILRWRSEDALLIYARMNDSRYADWLAKASQATVSSIRTTTIADNMRVMGIDNGGIQEAAFHDSWLRLAGSATVTEASKDKIPETDDSSLYGSINSNLTELMREAEREDSAAVA